MSLPLMRGTIYFTSSYEALVARGNMFKKITFRYVLIGKTPPYGEQKGINPVWKQVN